MKLHHKGRIVILSGPSGAGKTTLHEKLLSSKKLKGRLAKTVSVTTRPPRAKEKHGRDYLFVSKKMFFYKRKSGHFLEAKKVFQNYYGTPLKQVKEILKTGKSVLLCIDVQGAREVWRKRPDALKIFVKAPSLGELKKRLSQRGTEEAQDLRIRLQTAQKELKEAKNYDYVIVNDDLNQAFRALEKIVCREI